MDKKRQNLITGAYDRAAPVYAEKFFYELYDKPLDRKLYDMFYERTVNRGPVLEIGCGPGEIANYLAMKNLPVTGIDISEQMIAAARTLNSRIPFETGDVFALRFADQSIAGIVAPYLIVNFREDDVLPALRQMHRVLAPAGVLLISFHTGEKDLVVHDFFVPGNTLTFSLFDPDRIANYLVEAGFTVTDHLIRRPYQGEVTTRAYIFAQKA